MSAGAVELCRMVLLAALPQEVRPFVRQSQARRRRGLPWPAWEFHLEAGQGLLALSGMGAGAAREAAARLTAQFRPHLLISLGFGGAVTPELQPGDLVLGEFFYKFDPAVGVPEPVLVTPLPLPLAEMLQSLTAAGLPAFAGSLVNPPYFIHKASQAGPLRSLPYPVLDLESAAVAEVARGAGLPCFGLRAITDTAAEEIPDFLGSAGTILGTVGLLKALSWLAADPCCLKDLAHLWRRSRLAASRLGQALMALLPLLASSETLA